MARCSRCTAKLPHYRDPKKAEFTMGYYIVNRGGWKKFGRPGEVRICDNCMWDDPEYVKIYGDVRRTPST